MDLSLLQKCLALSAIVFSTARMEAGILKGLVYDRTTQEPLIGVSVLTNKSNIGTVTDIDGFFSFDLPAGRHNLTVKYVGYNDTIILFPIHSSSPIRTTK